MSFLDPNDPFFRPVWRRWATVGVPAAWACVEAWVGTMPWALGFAAAAAYAYYQLFIVGPDDPDGQGGSEG
ncbi:MAG: hypothetical protein KGI94_01380 [Paracoccaceae bacterium]|nr:hypothetical protein [Paracoccaceae bacterium]MDE3120791.1 hypothetical protein [Paracoccaceae bacterium]